jgi:hypothetical protein
MESFHSDCEIETRQWKLGKRQEKDPPFENPQKVGHPKAFFGIKARPPAAG